MASVWGRTRSIRVLRRGESVGSALSAILGASCYCPHEAVCVMFSVTTETFFVLHRTNDHLFHRFNTALKYVSRAIDMDTHPVVECNTREISSAEQHVLRRRSVDPLSSDD